MVGGDRIGMEIVQTMVGWDNQEAKRAGDSKSLAFFGREQIINLVMIRYESQQYLQVFPIHNSLVVYVSGTATGYHTLSHCLLTAVNLRKSRLSEG